MLLKRAAACGGRDDAVTLGHAVAAFLDRADLDAGTLRAYRHTMNRMLAHLGAGIPLPEVTAERVAELFAAAWGGAADATWNRHRAAVRSFAAWAARDRGWHTADPAARLGRRHEPRGRTPALDPVFVEALLARPGLALRERTLWTMLYESTATAALALSLDIEDVKSIGGTGGTGGIEDIEDIGDHTRGTLWGPRTAGLLPQLIAGRRRGPLFLADRRPAPARTPPSRDLCPETGRRRLSYERAEYLFKQASHGNTLYQLRLTEPAATRRPSPS
ncbi:site-specific integrase [Acrocarpospora corrugata]|uniref:site-specific integrase n=1 Tax=Acrocarpospora corrugata TaxID=35763 RepID=UPI003BEEFE28